MINPPTTPWNVCCAAQPINPAITRLTSSDIKRLTSKSSLNDTTVPNGFVTSRGRSSTRPAPATPRTPARHSESPYRQSPLALGGSEIYPKSVLERSMSVEPVVKGRSASAQAIDQQNYHTKSQQKITTTTTTGGAHHQRTEITTHHSRGRDSKRTKSSDKVKPRSKSKSQSKSVSKSISASPNRRAAEKSKHRSKSPSKSRSKSKDAHKRTSRSKTTKTTRQRSFVPTHATPGLNDYPIVIEAPAPPTSNLLDPFSAPSDQVGADIVQKIGSQLNMMRRVSGPFPRGGQSGNILVDTSVPCVAPPSWTGLGTGIGINTGVSGTGISSMPHIGQTPGIKMFPRDPNFSSCNLTTQNVMLTPKTTGGISLSSTTQTSPHTTTTPYDSSLQGLNYPSTTTYESTTYDQRSSYPGGGLTTTATTGPRIYSVSGGAYSEPLIPIEQSPRVLASSHMWGKGTTLDEINAQQNTIEEYKNITSNERIAAAKTFTSTESQHFTSSYKTDASPSQPYITSTITQQAEPSNQFSQAYITSTTTQQAEPSNQFSQAHITSTTPQQAERSNQFSQAYIISTTPQQAATTTQQAEPSNQFSQTYITSTTAQQAEASKQFSPVTEQHKSITISPPFISSIGPGAQQNRESISMSQSAFGSTPFSTTTTTTKSPLGFQASVQNFPSHRSFSENVRRMSASARKSGDLSRSLSPEGRGRVSSTRFDRGAAREIKAHELTAEHFILREEVKERQVTIPKKIITEEVIEKEVIVPETRVTEQIVEEKQMVKEKRIEIHKKILQEKIVEVPEIVYTERVVEVPEKIIQERLIEVPVIQIQERKVEIPKYITQEKIVEVIEAEIREVAVEKIIEKIVEVEEIQIKEKAIPRYIDRPVPQYVIKEEFQEVHRNIPVPIEAIKIFEFRLPKLRPHYVQIPIPIYSPRFVEVAIPSELLSPTQITQCEQIAKEVALLAYASAQRAISLCEIERVGAASKSISPLIRSQIDGGESCSNSIAASFSNSEYTITGEAISQPISMIPVQATQILLSKAFNSCQSSRVSYSQATRSVSTPAITTSLKCDKSSKEVAIAAVQSAFGEEAANRLVQMIKERQISESALMTGAFLDIANTFTGTTTTTTVGDIKMGEAVKLESVDVDCGTTKGCEAKELAKEQIVVEDETMKETHEMTESHSGEVEVEMEKKDSQEVVSVEDEIESHVSESDDGVPKDEESDKEAKQEYSFRRESSDMPDDVADEVSSYHT